MPHDSPSSAFPPSTMTGPTCHRLSASAAEGGGSTSKRSSLPPGFRHLQQQYNAHPSPLQRTLTPPPPEHLGPHDAEPFPSVESLESAGSGHNFHISASGLPTSASSNDNTSPLMRTHYYQHSQSSSFGSKADTLESKLHHPGRNLHDGPLTETLQFCAPRAHGLGSFPRRSHARNVYAASVQIALVRLFRVRSSANQDWHRCAAAVPAAELWEASGNDSTSTFDDGSCRRHVWRKSDFSLRRRRGAVRSRWSPCETLFGTLLGKRRIEHSS